MLAAEEMVQGVWVHPLGVPEVVKGFGTEG